MLIQSQLDRINHIRTSAGCNPVTMEQAQILLDQMNEADRTRAILVISKDEPPTPVKTCEDRIAVAVAETVERCARIADDRATSGSGTGYSFGCRDAALAIASAIRSGQ